MTIKVIVFDCGGVCLSNAWSEPVFDKIPELLGISKKKGDEIFYKFWPDIKLGKISEDFLFKEFAKTSRKKISPDEIKKFYHSLIYQNKDVMDLVKKLKRSYTLYTLNNEGKEWMDLRIQKFGLRKYFKGFITSGYVGHAKPDPEIYKILLKKSGLKPAEHIFIDNKEVNLAPARNLGFRTILFKNIGQLKKDLIALGVRVD